MKRIERFMTGVTGAFVMLVALALVAAAIGEVTLIASPLTSEHRMASRLGDYQTGVLACAVAPWLVAAGVRRVATAIRGGTRNVEEV